MPDASQLEVIRQEACALKANGEGETVPADFMFELSDAEFENLRFQFGTSRWGGRRYRPYDAQFKAVFDAIRELMAPVVLAKRAIGFGPWKERR